MTRPEFLLDGQPLTVQKIGAWVPVSCCQLADINPAVRLCEHHPPAPWSRRKRLRWWLQDLWARRPRVHLGPCDHTDCY